MSAESLAAGEGRPSEGLPPLSPLEEVYADYHATGMSLRGHPLQFCRDELRGMREEGIDKAIADVQRRPEKLEAAGLALKKEIRQFSTPGYFTDDDVAIAVARDVRISAGKKKHGLLVAS